MTNMTNMTNMTIDKDQATPDTVAEPLRLGVIIASVRHERTGTPIAQWVHQTIDERADIDLRVIDLAGIDLPDDAYLQPGGTPHGTAQLIDDCDGFVVVTPEYNHSYPAALKKFIDWHYTEWQFKAASVVSYGVVGGLLAAEQLRGVFAELNVVTTRRIVGLPAPWNHLEDEKYVAPDGVELALHAALDELVWWSETLRRARTEHPYPRR